MPSICASFFTCCRSASTSGGLAHTDSTGVLTASGSPLRSEIIAAVRADFDHPAVARIAFFLQKIIVYPLQIHAAPEQPGQPGQQHRK